MSYGLLPCVAAQRGGDGEQVEQNARRIGRDAEFCLCQPPGDVFRETGAEGQYAVLVAYLRSKGAISISVRNFILQKYKFYIFAV